VRKKIFGTLHKTAVVGREFVLATFYDVSRYFDCLHNKKQKMPPDVGKKLWKQQLRRRNYDPKKS
jgi:hypothetical protein